MYYVIGPDGRQYGPADLHALQAWVRAGTVTPSTVLVEIATGMPLRADDLPGLRLLFPALPMRPLPRSGHQMVLAAVALVVGVAVLSAFGLYLFAGNAPRRSSNGPASTAEGAPWRFTRQGTGSDTVVDTERFTLVFEGTRSQGTESGTIQLGAPGSSSSSMGNGSEAFVVRSTEDGCTIRLGRHLVRLFDGGARLEVGRQVFDLTKGKQHIVIRPDGTGQVAAHAPARPPALTLSASQAYARAMGLWKSGRQADAEGVAAQYLGRYPDDPHLTFFAAACTRSRFDLQRAAPLLAAASALNSGSVQGQCAAHVLAIDRNEDTQAHLAALRKLAEDQPSDPLVLWMLAVECRALHRSAEGAEHYRLLLRRIGTGSSLVHQTYANLLDDLGRHREALPHRYLAVKLEPARWSLEGLAGTLDSLGYSVAASLARMNATSPSPSTPSLPVALVLGEARRKRIYRAHDAMFRRLIKQRHAKSISGSDPEELAFQRRNHLTLSQMTEIDVEGEQKRWYR